MQEKADKTFVDILKTGNSYYTVGGGVGLGHIEGHYNRSVKF